MADDWQVMPAKQTAAKMMKSQTMFDPF